MATSETHICNLALGQIGAGRIANIQGTTQVERDCAMVFNDARDAVLADFDWAFAREQARLARLLETPKFHYAYAFQLPSDFIELRRFSVPNVAHEIVGDRLYANIDDCKITYTRRVEDPVKFPAKFIEILTHRLSALLAASVKKDPALSQSWWTTYYGTIGVMEARTNGGEQQFQIDENPYVTSRNSAFLDRY